MTIRLGVSRGPWLPDVTIFLAWVSGLVLTLISILSTALTLWRLGSDPGWTAPFFVSDGVFSRYPAWIVITAGAQTAAFFVKRWATSRIPAIQVLPASEARRRPVQAPEAAAAAV